MKIARKILRIISRTILSLIALVLLLWLLLQTETVQNWLQRKITARLSKELKTEISARHISLSFFDKANLEGVLVRDRYRDTLLYAGQLRVRLTDWFFLKDKIEITYLGLEDATIRQIRHDSTWNYQFLIDHFASKDTTKKSDGGIDLDIRKLDFKNVHYTKVDPWGGQDMYLAAGSLVLEAQQIDLKKKLFRIDKLELDKPVFDELNYQGLAPKPPASNLPAHASLQQAVAAYFNKANITVMANRITISNGTFHMKKRTDVSENGVFSGTNIHATALNGSLRQISFIKDTIRARIDLSLKERSGLVVKKFQAAFRLTPQIMEYDSLFIQTNRSTLRNYYAMTFRDFSDDMAEYPDSVYMHANFRNATVNSDDIAFFVPDLATWKQQVEVSGRFDGKVTDFKTKDMFLRKQNTYIKGDLAMKGLPDIDKTQITFTNGLINTNYRDAAVYIPALRNMRSPNLPALGTVQFRGDFKGTIHQFLTKGNVSTQLGGFYTNITMTLPQQGEPRYKGQLITQHFNLGRFINTNTLGAITFRGKIDGSSFALEKARMTLDGEIDQLEFNNYNYRDIVVNGTFAKQKFDGEFKIDDENFNFTSTVAIDLNGDKPSVNILGDLTRSNLQNLKLINKNFELSGFFDLYFTGKTIDDFEGSAKLLNATLMHDSTRLSFDSLSIASFYDTLNRKVLTIQSNELDIRLRGQYNLLDLPNSFQLFLSKYYPSYIKPPATTPSKQRFAVTVQTRDFEAYARLIDDNIRGLNYASLSGAVNTYDTGFYFRADIPSLQYKNYKIEDARLNGQGNFDSLGITGSIARFNLGDSTYFPDSKLTIRSVNDRSIVSLKTSANRILNDADLSLEILTQNDGVTLKYRPSSIVINDKKWVLEKDGVLVLRKSQIAANNVKFSSGLQEISVETEKVANDSLRQLVVRLKDINLGDFTPLFLKEPRLEGVATGRVNIRNPFGELTATSSLSVNQFRLNNDSVGLVDLSASYGNGTIAYRVLSDNDAYRFAARGSYNLKDSTGSPMQNTIQLNGAKIGILNQFLSTLFSDITGYATGTLTINGKPSLLQLHGDVGLKKGRMKVNYTQVYYNVDTALIRFTDEGIDFGSFTITDDLGNKGTVKGKLYENGFTNMRYDIDVTSNKMLVLDTRQKDNPLYFGKVFGKTNFSLKGPQEDMQLNISGEVAGVSDISIMSTTEKQTADADFIVFDQHGEEMEKADTTNASNITVNLDLTGNNLATVNFIIDPLTGDVITAKGHGRLRMRVADDVNITGRYNIDSGSYNFNFQSLIKYPFILRPDAGNYIEWKGDPFDATLKIDAQYTATHVSLNDLVSRQNFAGVVKGYRGDVFVIAELRGKLSSLDAPKFRIEFPPAAGLLTDYTFAQFLEKLESDENEMLTQVTWLIVFGSFAPYGQALSGGNGDGSAFRTLGINTISQQITSRLNVLFSDLLYKITKDKSWQLDIGAQTYSSSSYFAGGSVSSGGNNVLDRQLINFKVNKSLLNGNVLITVGSDFDFGLANSATVTTGNFQWLPDVSVQLMLTRDRKLRGVLFNKSNLDVTSGALGRRNRLGASINYTKDFDKYLEKRLRASLADSTAVYTLPVPDTFPPADSTKSSPRNMP